MTFTGNSITNCSRGLQIQNESTTYETFVVSGNQFYNGERALDISASIKNLSVTGNTFTNGRHTAEIRFERNSDWGDPLIPHVVQHGQISNNTFDDVGNAIHVRHDGSGIPLVQKLLVNGNTVKDSNSLIWATSGDEWTVTNNVVVNCSDSVTHQGEDSGGDWLVARNILRNTNSPVINNGDVEDNHRY